ncbi:MAG TPA: FAD/NAD(P)-binding protein, partial [Pyrinomonadaceae bacterium]|nr:FAD/NAD(P)-binding protein [Pyrinomonadaceae bacterium]
LLAEFDAHPLAYPLHIRLFNRSRHFGASPIYDPAQPVYILVNISVGEIDLWAVDDPPVVAGRGDDFLSWYQKTFQPQTPLTGDEYLSRAVVGRYLIEGFERLLEHLPPGVTVSRHVGEVSDVRPDERGGYQVEFVPAASVEAEEIGVDKVLLATGHSRLVPGVEETRYQEFAARHAGRAAFIPFVYPVVETMREIPAGARVAMLGIGLTFIDALLELTEGRGGRFERTKGGALAYTRSGAEPRVVFPYSRTGLPMTPKAHDLPLHARPLTFFTHDALAELRRRTTGGRLDFERDLWPLFELEMELHYYRVVFANGDARQELEACGNDARAMRRVIDAYLRAHPEQQPFDYHSALDPVGARRFESASEFDAFVGRYMEEEIARARAGLAGDGLKSAIDIWYEVRTVLGGFLQFGGLTPESHRKLIEHHYPRLKRVAFGPPIINIEKLLALARAGLLDFSVARSPRVLTDDASGRFELRCDEIPGAHAQVEVLVDARYPPTDIPRDATPLYRNLHRRGMVRAFENRFTSRDDSAYRPGAIDMTEEARFVVGEAGMGNEDIAVIGIPTEGNLVGNLTVARDKYAGVWAAEVVEQLRRRELAWAASSVETM